MRERGVEAGGREVQVREGRRRRQEGRGEVVASLEVGDLEVFLENKGVMMGGNSRYTQSTLTNSYFNLLSKVVFNDMGSELNDPSAIAPPLRPAEMFKV